MTLTDSPPQLVTLHRPPRSLVVYVAAAPQCGGPPAEEMWDYRCTGRDDQDVLLAAMNDNPGAQLQLSDGIFYYDRDVTFYRPVSVRGSGATVILLRGQARRGLVWSGSRVQLGGMREASAGAVTLTVDPKTARALSPGDWIVVASNSPFAARTYYHVAEWTQVLSVDTAGSTLKLRAPLRHSYPSAAERRIYRYDLLAGGFTVSDLSIRHSADMKSRLVGLAVPFTADARIERVHVQGEAFDNGIDLVDSLRPHTRNTSSKDILDRYNPDKEGYTGYGVHTVGTLDAVIEHHTDEGSRHGIDVSSYGWRPPSLRTRVRSCVARFTKAAGFATHGGADETRFEDVTAVHCGGGLINRGRATSFDLTIEGGTSSPKENFYTRLGARSQSNAHAVYLGEPTAAGAAPSPGGTQVRGRLRGRMDGHGGNARLIYCHPQTILSDVDIEIGEVTGLRNVAVDLPASSVTDLRLRADHAAAIRMSPQANPDRLLQIDNGSTTQRVDRLTVDLRWVGYANRAVVLRGRVDGLQVRVRVEGLRAPTFANSPLVESLGGNWKNVDVTVHGHASSAAKLAPTTTTR